MDSSIKIAEIHLVPSTELAVGSHPPGEALSLLGDGVADRGATGDLHTVGEAGDDGGDDGLSRGVGLAQTQPAILAPAQCEHSARVLQADGVMLTYGHLLARQRRQVLAQLRHEEGKTLRDRQRHL